jgi:hypothetical protein
MTRRSTTATAMALTACLSVLSAGVHAAVIPLASYNSAGGSFTGEVAVTANGSNASFVFRNTTSGGSSSLASIWFETGFASIFTGLDATLTQTGVNFSFDVTPLGPGNNAPPPAPNAIPSTPWTSNFAKLDKIGAAANGINPGEALTVVFGYSGTESALVGDLLNGFGDRRIALHLISAGNGECGVSATTGQSVDSCSIGVSAVPLPAAVWLLLSAILGLGGVARRVAKPTAC